MFCKHNNGFQTKKAIKNKAGKIGNKVVTVREHHGNEVLDKE